MQTYIVKGIRKPTKKGGNNANHFLPAAILNLQVYNNDFKHLQFIKEFEWHFLYHNIYFSVIKNAVAMFAIELLQHSIKQPENNPDLFYFIENSLQCLDECDATATANFPLYFILKLGDQLGFGIQENYSTQTPILDLQQGFYINDTPIHPYFIEQNLASITAAILNINSVSELCALKLNQSIRRQLIEFYIQYFTLHITNFIELRSLEVLKEVLD